MIISAKSCQQRGFTTSSGSFVHSRFFIITNLNYRVTNIFRFSSNCYSEAHSAFLLMKSVSEGSALWAISIPERNSSPRIIILFKLGLQKNLGICHFWWKLVFHVKKFWWKLKIPEFWLKISFKVIKIIINNLKNSS